MSGLVKLRTGLAEEFKSNRKPLGLGSGRGFLDKALEPQPTEGQTGASSTSTKGFSSLADPTNRGQPVQNTQVKKDLRLEYHKEPWSHQ